MTTSYDVATPFLAGLGAPATPAMKRAVAIWLAFESGGTIVGNNPWNLHSGPACTAASKVCPGNGSLPGQIGNRYAGSGDQNVAVFATIEDGARANAQNLLHQGSYGPVVTAARAGNALGFLSALQSSPWSAGHYSYSKLTGAFAGISGYNNVLTLTMPSGLPKASGGVPSQSPTATLASSGGITTLDKMLGVSADTTVSTDAERAVLDAAIEKLLAQGKITALVAKGLHGALVTAQVSSTLGGQPTKLSQIFVNLSDGTVPSVAPAESLKDAGKVAGDIAAFLFDPDNWKYIGALIVGVPLALFGFYLLAGVQTGGANA